MPEVEIRNVTKRFGKIVAVDNVSLHVHDREYFALLGPSGCGKTTLLRLIAGLIKPDEGEIYIDGKLVNDVPPEDREVGFVFQTFALFPHMNVWDNVTYGPRVKGLGEEKAARIANEALEMVLLHERLDAYPNELSGGMMQRVAVARALCAGAKLLLLDEPLGQLDAKVRTQLRYEIRRMAEDLGLTAIHVTHDQAEALAISDRIAVMRKGKILQVGTPQELYMKPKCIFVANFIGESNFLEGYIKEIGKDSSIIELRGGLKLKVSGSSLKKGERVVLAIRPETLALARETGKKTNCINGKIERLRFEGTNIRYEIKLENDDKIVIIRPSMVEKWLKPGTKVSVHFPMDKIYVFPYPSRGLREELSVE